MSDKTIRAQRQMIDPVFFPMAEIDEVKVLALVEHIRNGGKVPPVVVAMYDKDAMPLDGHHRLSAFKILGLQADAYVVDGEVFDELCAEERDAESFVLCDGVPARAVAKYWHDAQSGR